jgi:hypothetical protein
MLRRMSLRRVVRAPLLVAFASLAALGALGPACHHDGAARLEGRWHGVRAEGLTGDALAAANAFATGTQLEVKGDAITVTTPKDKQAGRYKVVKEDKATVVITTDKDGPDESQTFTFVDDKTMKWAVLEGKAIVFQKQ